MNKRYYEHTLPIIRGSLSNTYDSRALCPLHGCGIFPFLGIPPIRKRRVLCTTIKLLIPFWSGNLIAGFV